MRFYRGEMVIWTSRPDLGIGIVLNPVPVFDEKRPNLRLWSQVVLFEKGPTIILEEFLDYVPGRVPMGRFARITAFYDPQYGHYLN